MASNLLKFLQYSFIKLIQDSMEQKMRLPVVVIAWLCMFLIGCKQEVEISEGVIHSFTQSSISFGQFSENGKLLLAVTDSEAIKLWRLDTHEVELEIPSDKVLKPVKHVALSKDNSLLIIANSNTVSLWSVSAKSMISKVKFSGVTPYAAITALALSPNKDRLLVGMADGSINMADMNTHLNNRFKPHMQPVRFLRFDTQGELYMSGALDGKVGLWQFASSDALFEQTYAHRITSLTANDDFSKLFVSDGLDSQYIKALTSGEEITKLHYNARFKVFRQSLFIEDGRLLATSSSKSHLSLWHVSTGNEIGTWTINTRNKGASIVAMHSDNAGKLLTFNSDGMVERWNLNLLEAL
jgi:WD40 repeat protein